LIKWEIYQIYAKFSKLKAEGFFLFGLLSHLSSADVKKRGHCSRARMQIKFCKLICTREENVHSIRLLLVHRKRCALKAIVQLAQNFYIQKHCLGFATPSHKIHTQHVNTKRSAVSPTIISSATISFIRCHVQLCIAANAESDLRFFTFHAAVFAFLHNHACVFERNWLRGEINQKCKSRCLFLTS